MKLDALVNYCLSLEGAFKRYPFRRSGNPLIMTVLKNKMFCAIYENSEPLHVLLKCDPMEADILRSIYPSVKAGYHMNKSHWNSVYLDGTVPDKVIKRMVLNSYNLVVGKPKRSKPDTSLP